MPATFPSHQAAVLPLKLWRPRWFDGVGLAAGAAAPDAGYVLIGLVPMPGTHTIPALLWFALPVAYLACLVIRRAAPVVAAHLPPAGPFRLRDYGVLGAVRHPWYITASSILVGAATHLFWDGFTHAPIGMHGWAVAALPVLQTAGPFGVAWWRTVQHVSNVLGAAAAALVAWRLGRSGALVRWHGEAPAVPRSMGRFWGSAAVVAVGCLVVLPMLPRAASAHVTGVRMLYAVALALLAGAVATRSPRSLSTSAT